MNDPHSELCEALRQLLDTAVRLRPDDQTNLTDAIESIRAINRYLTPLIPNPPPPRYAFTETPSFEELFAYDFVMGEKNPVAVPLRFANQDKTAIAYATFGTVYEGPPDCVHGAVISAAFDQVLNIANLLAGTPGPTVHLRLDFRKPTPLQTPIRFEATCDKVEGNRIHSSARCYADDVLTVEAEGVFASIDLSRIQSLNDS